MERESCLKVELPNKLDNRVWLINPGWGRAPSLRVSVVRGFNFVPHDPEGAHYRILKFSMKLEQLKKSGLLRVNMSTSVW